MTDLQLASMVFLWVVVLVFGVLLFALARQVGVILERVSPVGALMTNESLHVGGPAPRMQLTTIDGAKLEIGYTETRAETPYSQLLLFVGPKCPICRILLPAAKSIAKRESAWMRLVLASDGGTEEAHRRYRAKHSLEDIPYVVSELLGRAYGVAKLPYAVLIDDRQRIVSFGMVNSREHIESLVEAKQLGFSSLQEYLRQDADAEDSEQSPETDAAEVEKAGARSR